MPFATGVSDTGGAPWAANISANFRKNSKRPYWYTQGLGGNWFMKKTRSRKSRDTVPLSRIFVIGYVYSLHAYSLFIVTASCFAGAMRSCNRQQPHFQFAKRHLWSIVHAHALGLFPLLLTRALCVWGFFASVFLLYVQCTVYVRHTTLQPKSKAICFLIVPFQTLYFRW